MKLLDWIRQRRIACKPLLVLLAMVIGIAVLQSLITRQDTIIGMIKWIGVLCVVSAMTSAVALYVAIAVKSRKP